jgi:hypothetical protein
VNHFKLKYLDLRLRERERKKKSPTEWGCGCRSVVEYLPLALSEVLGLISSTTKQNKTPTNIKLN